MLTLLSQETSPPYKIIQIYKHFFGSNIGDKQTCILEEHGRTWWVCVDLAFKIDPLLIKIDWIFRYLLLPFGKQTKQKWQSPKLSLEHWGTCVILNYGFLRVYTQGWDCWVIGNSIFIFLRNLSILSPVAVSIHIPASSERGFHFPHTLSSIYCL